MCIFNFRTITVRKHGVGIFTMIWVYFLKASDQIAYIGKQSRLRPGSVSALLAFPLIILPHKKHLHKKQKLGKKKRYGTYVNVLKFRTFYAIPFWPKFCFLCNFFFIKISCGMTHSVDPDQTAPSEAV